MMLIVTWSQQTAFGVNSIGMSPHEDREEAMEFFKRVCDCPITLTAMLTDHSGNQIFEEARYAKDGE